MSAKQGTERSRDSVFNPCPYAVYKLSKKPTLGVDPGCHLRSKRAICDQNN